ncbi:carboxy-terminal domain RNA polymerase II polypeptide A small phosphatase 2 [Puma concolor]|uniref:Carboxy-terminal domain RNA polymerase II polypeptide A small phosphatase 2 n=1 Tax=Puma concolor TaxID=9696 RepID=A0A6P6I5X5_PUMCO|nr:carboxy-terminal domain RNA polymerase II polypeptide A small phosphatase 2 [Puma concolor]
MEHGSIITQARREDALVLTKQGLVSKSSPKKPRGRNIFKAFFCCFRAQHVGQSSSSTELSAYKEEANTIAKSDLLHCLQYQFYQIPGTCLLPEVTEEDQGRICVVIDLDETLVHSSFKPINNADFIVPVEIEGTTHQVSCLPGHSQPRGLRASTPLVCSVTGPSPATSFSFLYWNLSHSRLSDLKKKNPLLIHPHPAVIFFLL